MKPSQWETERALLGCLAVAPDLMAEVGERVVAADLGNVWCRTVYEAMQRLSAAGDPWDLVTLCTELETKPLAEWGGAAWLFGLPSAAPSVDAWPAYARIIRKAALARNLREAAQRTLADIEQGEDEPEDILARHEMGIGGLRRMDSGRDGFVPVAETVPVVVGRYEERARTGVLPGVATGIAPLDAKLAGLHRGDLIILGAPPATGKTAMALCLARGVARRGGLVAMFSMEMDREALVGRMACAEGRLDADAFRLGKLDAMGRRRFHEAAERIASMPIHIDEKRGLSITEIRLRARRLAQRRGPISLLIVDYLQLAKGTPQKGANREREVAEISVGLRTLGQEIDAPVLALAQLNRAHASRGKDERRPVPQDLRDSGQIEQDADVILFLYRDELVNPDSPDKGVCEIIIAKQRNGALGKVRLAWKPEHQDFLPLDERHEAPPTRRYAGAREMDEGEAW